MRLEELFNKKMEKMEKKFQKPDNTPKKIIEEYKPTTENSGFEQELNSEPEIDEHIQDDYVNKRDN